MPVKFKVGDLVQILSKEEIIQKGYLLSSLGAEHANQIGVIRASAQFSFRSYWKISFKKEIIPNNLYWPEALLKKVISSKNNIFEI